MKTVLLFWSLFISLSVFAQSEPTDSLTLFPSRSVTKLAKKSICCLAEISCFPVRISKNHYLLGPNGSRVRGERYEELAQLEQINIRTGLRGAYSHYYINGIRVTQDFTPREIVDDIDISTSGTPAFDEGTSLFPRQDQLLIY